MNNRASKKTAMKLFDIQDTITKVAEAITAALEIETEIIDNELRIIGGTGRYVPKIGGFEEGGDLESTFIYGRLLRKGQDYVCKDAQNDKDYAAKEGELAEICCPIKHEGEVLGIIGLIAFDEAQQNKIVNKTETYMVFLNRMADLIASKLVMIYNARNLETQLASILMPTEKTTYFEDIIGESKAISGVKRRGLQVATSDSTVLITGESGCGKELFARAIHFESNRKSGPFVAINCGAIPEMLLESELFGYEKGAFTGANQNGKMGKFELADKGTLFLDEIGDMALHLQVKLLYALQNRQIDRVGGTVPVDIDVRIVAATNKNLEEMIENKQFREDLYFRLNVIPLEIPPLRVRPSDIELLLNHALDHFKALLGKNVEGFSEKAMEKLKTYNWPGNVRELENVVEYAVNMEESKIIQDINLPDRLQKNKEAYGGYHDKALSMKTRTDELHKRLIRECLESVNNSYGNREAKAEAAKILGISESSLYRRIKELGVYE